MDDAERGALDDWISDDELTELALGADPAEALDDDAVPFTVADAFPDLLPAWYMPAPMATASHRGSRRRRVLVGVFVGSLLVLNGLGLCVTSGVIEIA